jgi:hypothetical protein
VQGSPAAHDPQICVAETLTGDIDPATSERRRKIVHDSGVVADNQRFTSLPHHEREIPMALYELRTYTLHVGKMAEAVKLYQEIGFPALQKGGQDKKLVGYFQSDTGTINQLVHLWKFDDDADRRAHWAAVYANKDFVEGFASKFRPLLMTQEVKLLHPAPWGPHP